MKNPPLMYVDAFAGTGYRENDVASHLSDGFFQFPEIDELAKGSARVALEVSPPFDKYVFIEMNRGRFEALRELEREFPARKDCMTFKNAEANFAITELCRTTDWRRQRAVMFLDPHGMQVDWSTIQAIADTKAVDLWYLVPTGMGLNRLMTRDGDIPGSWEARLDRMLGDPNWRNEFYVESHDATFFDGIVTTRTKIYDDARVEKFILGRLSECFAGVADHALRVQNSKGQCMYLLTFACGNERGARVALPIARDVLRD